MKLFSNKQEGVITDYLAVGGEKDKKGILYIYDVMKKQLIFSKVLEEKRHISCIETTIENGNTKFLAIGTLYGTIQIFKVPTL